MFKKKRKINKIKSSSPAVKEIIQMNLLAKQKQTHRLRKQIYGYQGGRDSYGVWDQHIHTAIFKMDNQQGPTKQHRELCSVLCGSLNGRGVQGKMDTCLCMAESLCCSPETIITLLIGCGEGVSHSVTFHSLQLHGLQPTRLFCPWNSPGKNSRVCSYSLFQRIFPGSNPGLPNCRQILYHLSHQGSPQQVTFQHKIKSLKK